MIRVLVGDLFRSSAQTLVNTVNCVGIMGKGIALEFRKRFPEMFEDYEARCARKQVRLGQPYLFRHLLPPWILNFPTKEHWRSVSKLSDIEAALTYLEQHYREWRITSLAVPPLGCGLGQLEWRVVGRTLYRHLSRLEIPVELYAPMGTPTAELQPAFLAGRVEAAGGSSANGSTAPPRVEPAWVALVEVVHRIVREPFHWPVGRTVFQKIAYFGTESGLPTGLEYVPGSYGPFSPDLKCVLTTMANNGLLEEERLGRMFSVRPGRTFADAASSYSADLKTWEPAIDRIVDLFLRMNTDQAEIAATVHFAARALARKQGKLPSEMEVLDEVRRWKQRRRPPLLDEEVARSIRDLNVLRWVELTPSDYLPLPQEELLEA